MYVSTYYYKYELQFYGLVYLEMRGDNQAHKMTGCMIWQKRKGE